ncbi:MAG: aminomethyl-transferring glycine dehydrogenase subunit GcvPA [Chloroflexota bacterium]
MPYLPHTDRDRQDMLAAIGVASVEDLLVDVPLEVRCGPLDVPAPLDEATMLRHLEELAGQNRHTAQMPSFLGGGAYHHHIPSVVGALASRGEFVTSYTPYQPELSQGTLQAIYEFQSLICALTGLDVANASLYDAATACAEAMALAVAATGRAEFVVSAGLTPDYLATLRTYAWSQNLTLHEVPLSPHGTCDPASLAPLLEGGRVAGVLVQSPTYHGVLEDQRALAEAAHAAGALLITCANPLSLALLASPGECGADVAVGDAQPFGTSLSYGGPYVGYMAARESLLRRLPGRIAGASVDSHGNRAYVLTYQTREQHIRREKATSNICSNHALNALVATIYLSYMGKTGLRQVADLCVRRAHYAAERIAALPGYHLPFAGTPFFHEFVVMGPRPAAEINAALLRDGILGGVPIPAGVLAGPPGQREPAADGLLFCVTEMNSREEIDHLVSSLERIAPR